MKKKERTHKQTVQLMEETSPIVKKLQKLFELNKKNLKKENDNLIKIVADEDLLFSAYEKLKGNKGAMTKGTDDSSPDAMTIEIIRKISKQVKAGKYQWGTVRKKEIPKSGRKEKRPLGIPNFNDRIVQECVRIVLNVIYEPIFQHYEFNHGFRSKRGTHSAMIKLQRESKEMNWALEGDIKSAYPNVNHRKLLQILRRKIKDKKLLDLIRTGLQHNISFEGKIEQNLVGVPQGGIVSPILFNIYMHEFDLEVDRKVGELLKLNEKEKRTEIGKYSKSYRRYSSRIEKNWKKMKESINNEKKKEKYKKAREIIRKSKKLLLKTRAKTKKSLLLRFAYTRYADDWILLTNGTKGMLVDLKEYLKEWLEKELFWELNEKKTLITNLDKEKARFVGFTIYRKKKRIIRKQTKKGNIYRQRSTVPLTYGIDRERVKQKLIHGKMLLEKTMRPGYINAYVGLRNWQIVEKFKQRLEGFANYYHRVITYPSELNYYYYVYKFSCLKTLARKMNKSITKISIKYGVRMKIPYTIEKKKKESDQIVKEERKSYFPTYKEMMRNQKLLTDRANNKLYERIKKQKNNDKQKKQYFEKNGINEILLYKSHTDDPFSMKNISVNLRSQYQLNRYCAVCGAKPTPRNPIEAHHVKHVRKGKVSGFTQNMKSLNRKTVPCCRKCHKKIHKGIYDGYSLRNLFDPNLIDF